LKPSCPHIFLGTRLCFAALDEKHSVFMPNNGGGKWI
jgi:hypothetical protein